MSARCTLELLSFLSVEAGQLLVATPGHPQVTSPDSEMRRQKTEEDESATVVAVLLYLQSLMLE
jgi:hypothetical protein